MNIPPRKFVELSQCL